MRVLIDAQLPPGLCSWFRERGVEVTTKPAGLRISTHYYNAESDVDTCVGLLSEYRRGSRENA